MKYLIHVGSNKLHGLLKGIGITGTGVKYEGPKCDIRQKVRIFVDLINRVEHGFEPLDALLLLDGAARVVRVAAHLLVHGEYAPQNEVPIQADHLPRLQRIRTVHDI